MFANRTTAGEALADLLVAEGVEADIVLGIPRGGLPAARAVADRLGAPLSIIAAKKLGAPNNPEFAIGSVAADGSLFVDEQTVERFGITDAYIEREREEAHAKARAKVETYLEEGMPDLSGMTVVIVDDGLATGATATACVRAAKSRGAERVVLAVPVASKDSVKDLEREADAVFVVATPAHFRAVGAHYRQFGQVSDEEARTYLRTE